MIILIELSTRTSIDENECYLLSYDSSTVTCFCLHLTYLGVKSNEFTPEVNFLSLSEWRQVTFENIGKHPLGLIVVTVWILFCLSLITLLHLNHKQKITNRHLKLILNKLESINDKPLIAETKENVQRILNDKELKSKYRSIQEITLIKDDKWKDHYL